jgi:hypothetical protein
MHRLALSLLALAACTDDPAPSGPDVTSHVSSYEIPASTPAPLDLLFVDGDTTNYDLSALPGLTDSTVTRLFDGFPDVRVATTSSDSILELKTDLFGNHTQSFMGSLGDALMARLAPGSTQVLARMQLAVGFARDDAYLGVFVITGSDDTSPDASYATMLKATKTDPAKVTVSGIYQRPAPRLDAFLDAFPNRSAFTSIDSADFAPAFELLAQLQKTPLGVACVPLPLDLDPDAPGDQIDCAVSAYEGATEVSRVPACASTDPATGSCWEVIPNLSCTEAGTAELSLRGHWHRFHPAIRWECVTK